jgi:hypothetical protein
VTESRPLADAADLVGEFNRATLRPAEGWGLPGDAYVAAGELARLAHRLEQAVNQLVIPVAVAGEADVLTVEQGHDLDDVLVLVMSRKESARSAAAQLARAVDELHAALSPLGARLPDDS